MGFIAINYVALRQQRLTSAVVLFAHVKQETRRLINAVHLVLLFVVSELPKLQSLATSEFINNLISPREPLKTFRLVISVSLPPHFSIRQRDVMMY